MRRRTTPRPGRGSRSGSRCDGRARRTGSRRARVRRCTRSARGRSVGRPATSRGMVANGVHGVSRRVRRDAVHPGCPGAAPREVERRLAVLREHAHQPPNASAACGYRSRTPPRRARRRGSRRKRRACHRATSWPLPRRSPRVPAEAARPQDVDTACREVDDLRVRVAADEGEPPPVRPTSERSSAGLSGCYARAGSTRPAASRSASARSVRSHVKSRSSRPKWPYADVFA